VTIIIVVLCYDLALTRSTYFIRDGSLSTNIRVNILFVEVVILHRPDNETPIHNDLLE